MVKRILSGIIICCMCLTTCAFASGGTSKDYVDQVAKVITDFYTAKDNYTEMKYNDILSEDRYASFQNKIKAAKEASKSENDKKENYRVAVKLLKQEKDPEFVLLEYQVTVKYNYVNADFETTEGETVTVRYNKSSGKITDVYFSDETDELLNRSMLSFLIEDRDIKGIILYLIDNLLSWPLVAFGIIFGIVALIRFKLQKIAKKPLKKHLIISAVCIAIGVFVCW